MIMKVKDMLQQSQKRLFIFKFEWLIINRFWKEKENNKL